MFAAQFMTTLLLNIGKKIFYLFIQKLKIIQEDAFSDPIFSTLDIWNSETLLAYTAEQGILSWPILMQAAKALHVLRAVSGTVC